MKKIILLLICLVLLSAGCVQKDGKNVSSKNASAASAGKLAPEKMNVSGTTIAPLSAKITSPNAGEILSRNSEVKFDSIVKGGKEPYVYSWTSNMNGVLSTESSFTENTSKLNVGEHDIILKVTDASGSSVQASVVALIL